MRGLPGRRLWVPAVLSFSSVVGCPSGGDDVGDDGSSGPSTSDASSSSATMSTTATSTMTTAADSSSGTAESSTAADSSGSESGGPVDCFGIASESLCADESTCVYLGEFGGCVRNCEMITDLTECAATQFCVVYGETCGYEPIA